MKLLITPTSPFARRARVVIAEKGLSCATAVASPWEDAAEVTANSPLRKVPVLLADGGALLDSRVICEFLDALPSDAPPLLPADAAARARVQSAAAVADGATDACTAIAMAGRVAPDMQDDAWKNWLLAKADGALDYFEKNPPAAAPDMAGVALGCLLGFLDFRQMRPQWRDRRPALAAWWQAMAARASFQSTVPQAG